MTIWVYSGRPSEGAALLAKQPGFRRMKAGAAYKKGDVIVCWGSIKGLPTPVMNPVLLNEPGATPNAVNKKLTFQILAGQNIQVVPWTANQAVAKEWLAEGGTVVARKTLTGHEGGGIIIIEKGGELVDAPLYTKYIFKDKEFRVHATSTEAFATHRKVRDPKREPTNWKVRSWKNGFIFQRNNVQPSAKRDALAVSAVAALGLDFGAVDIIEDKHGNFYVLEINTAPGIEGQTVPEYGAALTKLANDRLNQLGGGKPAVPVGAVPGKPAPDHHVAHVPQGAGKAKDGPAVPGTDAATKVAIKAVVAAIGGGRIAGESDEQYILRLFGHAG